MAKRGGYRVGAGRPKGSRNLTPKPIDMAAVQRIAGSKVAANMTPLQYMLLIMNDPEVDPLRRDRMAIAACAYCHPRAADTGKKSRATEDAETAGRDSEWGDDLGETVN
jgi:hypothetical protein